MTKLRQVDEVSPNHVGEVGNARRKDGFASKATDLFLEISSGFNPKTRQLYIHHFVLKDKNQIVHYYWTLYNTAKLSDGQPFPCKISLYTRELRVGEGI